MTLNDSFDYTDGPLVTVSGPNCAFTTNASDALRFLRVYRVPQS